MKNTDEDLAQGVRPDNQSAADSPSSQTVDRGSRCESITDEGSDSNTCLELALEGERLCKEGNCRAGVAFFQAAIQAGTNDLRTLSAIYSQLGNAYFYLGDYTKAMEYHKHDLTLARSMGDKLGEAKSSGNLGNTLKLMGKFDEAIVCCNRHLKISKQIGDKLSEARAVYNLGNVYHAKAKQVGRIGNQDPGEISGDVKECLELASLYYKRNLTLMAELDDIVARGRALGNLGNIHYLMGDFQHAIYFHSQRLNIAQKVNDKAAERRANTNLGNSYIFLGEFENAAEHYRRALILTQELRDRAVEAQACYSLGNTYTLLRDYLTAIQYHLKHLDIAQELGDKVGEGRACWSLGNAYSAIGNHEKALYFAKQHLHVSKELGDLTGQATAQINVEDIQKILGIERLSDEQEETKNETQFSNTNVISSSPGRYRLRRQSMDNLDLIKLTPDGKQKEQSSYSLMHMRMAPQPSQEDDEDYFFEQLSRFQSERMDDQRCVLRTDVTSNKKKLNDKKNEEDNDMLDLIESMQSKRMDEQRVTLPSLPGLKTSRVNLAPNGRDKKSVESNDDSFIEMLVRCQSSRLEDQRSPLPDVAMSHAADQSEDEVESNTLQPGATIPVEDFFTMIQRLQAGRMEDQRASGPQHT